MRRFVASRHGFNSKHRAQGGRLKSLRSLSLSGGDGYVSAGWLRLGLFNIEGGVSGVSGDDGNCLRLTGGSRIVARRACKLS